MMSSIVSFLLASSLLSPALTLQVTPNSPCTSVCLDDPTQTASDPNASKTLGFDIVCRDSDFASTAVGQKFERCLNCLQNSSATASGENDQAWFLYNLRFAFNACIFGTTNASDPVSTPCSVDTVCGHLENALADGMDNPSTMSQYGYCTAYDSSFVGASQNTCRQCLEETSDEHYLSNFLVALQAGCTQQPLHEMTIGLNSTVFSPYEISITFPQSSESSSGKHKSLPTAAYIGIGVAGAMLIVILIAIVFVYIRKTRNARRLKKLRSPLDPRFGAPNITAPNRGAFTSPKSSPPINPDGMPMKLVPAVNHQEDYDAPDTEDEWYDLPVQERHISYAPSSGPPSYSPPSSGRQSVVPTHHAYIPPQYTPPSRNSTSPKYLPPKPSPSTQQSPRQEQQAQFSPSSARSVPLNNPCHSPPSSARSLPSQPKLSPHLRSNTPLMPIQTNHSQTVSLTNPDNEPYPNIVSFSRPIPRNNTSSSRRTQASKTKPASKEVTISGPMVRVSTRFENEEQARTARERLYRDGMGGTMVHGANSRELPEEKEKSPESAVSEEQWPGSF